MKLTKLMKLDQQPLEVFLRLPKNVKNPSCLFSDGSKDSRWSILAWDPVETVRGNGQLSIINDQFSKRYLEGKYELPFVGGAIGTIDYEGGHEFYYYDKALVYDHHNSQWWGINTPSPVETRLIASLPTSVCPDLNLKPIWDFDEYKKSFDFIHENIRKGEIYQACLTFPFIGKPVENTRALFYQLAKKNPAPMSAYLEQSERTVMSLSPERFISWDGSTLETKPIKGTRPRGKTLEEDERLKNELLADEKEKAELCMITDLLRNDMARVSKPGSVKVLEHQALQACPNVWHTYSHIRSETKEGINAWEIIEKMFPGGSISGCPKKRAVELLAEVETAPRGIYTGCIGYISDHGTMDMNIAIRTLEQNNEEIRAGFGSGIVYDSVAEAEYNECFDKAKLFQ